MSISQDKIIARLRNQFLADCAAEFDDFVSCHGDECESPIEVVLMAAVLSKRRPWVHFCYDFEVEHLGHRPAGAYIFKQFEIGPYRVDFVVVSLFAEKEWCTIIECDGHDFHERTKAQAARDRKRDRFFVKRGYQVIRFTGSEIWANPEGCADEFLSHISPLASMRDALSEPKESA